MTPLAYALLFISGIATVWASCEDDSDMLDLLFGVGWLTIAGSFLGLSIQILWRIL